MIFILLIALAVAVALALLYCGIALEEFDDDDKRH